MVGPSFMSSSRVRGPRSTVLLEPNLESNLETSFLLEPGPSYLAILNRSKFSYMINIILNIRMEVKALFFRQAVTFNGCIIFCCCCRSTNKVRG
jgi:hypothetical protein